HNTNAPVSAACPTGNLAAPNLDTTACVTNSTEFNAAKINWPNGVIRGRIEQPWGHIQAGFVTNVPQLNDGRFIDKSWFGYGGGFTGDVKPFSGVPGPFGLPGAWNKDDITFGIILGEG